MVIQTLSTNPSINWNLGWSQYVNGFGSLESGNFWLGLEAMYQMTGAYPSRLMVQMTEAGTGALSVVLFGQFSVGAASTNYRLQWSSITGDVYFYSANLNGHDIVRLSQRASVRDLRQRPDCSAVRQRVERRLVVQRLPRSDHNQHVILLVQRGQRRLYPVARCHQSTVFHARPHVYFVSVTIEMREKVAAVCVPHDAWANAL
jgi:hypothetical protein